MDFMQLFIYFITVKKYRFCISVIVYINMQIIGINRLKKNLYRSITFFFFLKHVNIFCYQIHKIMISKKSIICDPLCEIQAKVSKSSYEINIQVGFLPLISL